MRACLLVVAILGFSTLASAQHPTDSICLNTSADSLLVLATQNDSIMRVIDSLGYGTVNLSVVGTCDSAVIRFGQAMFQITIATVKKMNGCSLSVTSTLLGDTVVSLCPANPVIRQLSRPSRAKELSLSSSALSHGDVRISYNLGQLSKRAEVLICTPRGVCIRKLPLSKTSGVVTWDGRDKNGFTLPGGMYLSILSSEGKMVASTALRR